MTRLIESLSSFFKRWFHKRNIIIISERKVKHVPISGYLQFAILVSLIFGVGWASYSTGSYIAARTALKEQGQALRSVTNAHIESNFNAVIPAVTAVDADPIGSAPYRHALSASTNLALSTGPMSALSALDNAKLVARIQLLENKVVELKNTNEAIVQRVHDKTMGRMGELENVIKQTGLNLSELKKEYTDTKAKHDHKVSAEGGPFIPDDEGMSSQEKEMLEGLDNLAMLTAIVDKLPLSRPIQEADEQSPFGRRIDPINGHLAFHSGLDLAGPVGSKIYAPADGKIIFADVNGAYGNSIDIDHGSDITTRYGHLSKILVHEGQQVKKGDVIGIQGSTGRSTGAHLHYEVRYHDQAINPKNFLAAGDHVWQN